MRAEKEETGGTRTARRMTTRLKRGQRQREDGFMRNLV